LRGSAPVDLAAVADVVVRIGALMRAQPEITEIDINPLMAYPQGVLALDALIVAAP
jgi:succinyl-CoA synthetase beta subunit